MAHSASVNRLRNILLIIASEHMAQGAMLYQRPESIHKFRDLFPCSKCTASEISITVFSTRAILLPKDRPASYISNT